MVSFTDVRKYLTTNCSLTTSEMERLRDELYSVAHMAVEIFPRQSWL